MKIPSFDISGRISKRELRDAARQALQSAAAAALTYTAMKALGMEERFVGVLSAVVVVQPSAGHTLGAAKTRVLATLVGCVVGVSCLVLLPSGYGTAVALAISVLVMNGISGFRSDWNYGVVAAVALALGSDQDPFDAAQSRGLALGLGSVVGVLVSLIIWPDTARKRAERHLRSALRAVARRLDDAVGGIEGDGDPESPEARRRYHENFQGARDAAQAIRFGDNEALLETLDHVERLYNSVLILNRVAEETDDATADHDELADEISTLREIACRAIRSFAHGDDEHDGDEQAQPEQDLDRFTSSLDRARELAARETGDPRRDVFRSALVFGLGEVNDSLAALREIERRS